MGAAPAPEEEGQTNTEGNLEVVVQGNLKETISIEKGITSQQKLKQNNQIRDLTLKSYR